MLLSDKPSAIRARWREREAIARDRDITEQIHREDVSIVRVHKEGALIEVVAPTGWNPYESDKTRKRSAIWTFSKASRLNQMFKLAQVSRKAPLPVFLSLTYPWKWPEDWSTWKEHLNHFGMMLKRAYPEVAAMWKLEPQRRMAPHFHLMAWNVRHLPWQWVAVAWASVIHGIDMPSGFPVFPGKKGAAAFRAWLAVADLPSEVKDSIHAGTSVEKIRSWNGVAFYVAKYLAKEVTGDFGAVGRYWGIIGRKNMPWSPVEEVGISTRTAYWIKRIARRWARSKGIRLGAGRKLRLITTEFQTWMRVCEIACDLATERPKLVPYPSWSVDEWMPCNAVSFNTHGSPDRRFYS